LVFGENNFILIKVKIMAGIKIVSIEITIKTVFIPPSSKRN
jgi:hypothetical protein